MPEIESQTRPLRLPAVQQYLLRHWNGVQGLAWSFWINLVLIRIATFAMQDQWFKAAGESIVNHWVWVLLFVIFAHLLLFTWQAVGLLRACTTHLRNFGSVAYVWLAQTGLIIALLYTGLYIVLAWQALHPSTDEKWNSYQQMLKERGLNYSIESNAGSSTVLISGTLELGIADAFEKHLESNPGIQTVVLESDGGNLYQARAMAQRIRANALTTQVNGRCSSACTIAFIGGTKRLISSTGQLGFHQYRTDANYQVPFADTESEQQADRDLFAAAGVREEFLAEMFNAQAQSLWFPTHQRLLEAGVVTELVE